FEFKNMALVNLRSFAVRNVLGLLRKHYGALALLSAGTHPTLLPWKNAHPNLKGMLAELGTRTHLTDFSSLQIERLMPGFDRLFQEKPPEGEGLETQLRDLVFGPRSRFPGTSVAIGVDEHGKPLPGTQFPLRVLPPDWMDPSSAGAASPVMSQFST